MINHFFLLIKIIDFFFDKKKKCSGGTLKDVLKHIKQTQKDPKVPEPVLSRIFKQVLIGLKYLHKDRHMVHRDIKPSNILVSAEGIFKISDFGTSAELENTLAKCATFVGTTNYMSAERLKGDQYSYSSDIWSMGVNIFDSFFFVVIKSFLN